MELKVINQEFTVCKIDHINKVDFTDEFCFLGKTEEEISLVCSTSYVPSETIERNDGWRAFRIEGILDFSLIGILSKITAILADHHIGVFAVSTYNTDYIMTKVVDFEKALDALKKQGYIINRE